MRPAASVRARFDLVQRWADFLERHQDPDNGGFYSTTADLEQRGTRQADRVREVEHERRARRETVPSIPVREPPGEPGIELSVVAFRHVRCTALVHALSIAPGVGVGNAAI